MTAETAPERGVATDEPVHVGSADELDDLVAEYDVVVADFYADWCGPCRALEPMVERLAAETDAVVAKVDVDVHQRLATDYGVRGVPTLVHFAGGEQVDRTVGVPAEATLRSTVEEYAR
jgi:thioredoxin 1